MKTATFNPFLFLFLISFYSITAQVSVDHPVQLTGSGTNAKLTGIQSVSTNKDAVSVDYLQRDSLQFAAATGNSNAYAVNLSPAVTNQYTVGMVVNFKAGFANTGPATLNVNSLGADTIMKNYNSYLAANDIQNGQMVSVMYDGQYFQMLTQLGNSSTAVPHGKQLFNSSGTFTVPSGVTTVWVTMSGGGGGSGNSTPCNSGAGGGGGGGGASYLDYQLSVASLANYSITVGQGGAAGGNTGINGSNGGSSSFGNLLSANGGSGGSFGENGSAGGGGAGGVAGSGGISGGGGTSGSNLCSGGSGANPGTGGGSMFGSAGGGYGAGGTNGGNGTQGFVSVAW